MSVARSISGGSYHPFCRGHIVAAAFGRYYSNKEPEPDWTFRNLQKPEDAHKDSPLTRHLPRIASQMGIKTIFAPSPTKFNGEICDTTALNTVIPLGRGLEVRRGAFAEGCLLKIGEAFAISAAGCALLIGWRVDPATHEPLCVGVAHAGLVSIFNNVAGNLLAALGNAPQDTFFTTEFAISSDILCYQWDYPESGWQNEALCRFVNRWWGPECTPGWADELERREGRVHTAAMLRKQLMGCGVPYERITEGLHVENGSRLYTTRDGSNKRNLMIVARY